MSLLGSSKEDCQGQTWYNEVRSLWRNEVSERHSPPSLEESKPQAGALSIRVMGQRTVGELWLLKAVPKWQPANKRGSHTYSLKEISLPTTSELEEDP